MPSIDEYRGLATKALSIMFAPFGTTAGVRVSVNEKSYTPAEGGIWLDAKIFVPYKTLDGVAKREKK